MSANEKCVYHGPIHYLIVTVVCELMLLAMLIIVIVCQKTIYASNIICVIEFPRYRISSLPNY